jgi:hypothetical protein
MNGAPGGGPLYPVGELECVFLGQMDVVHPTRPQRTRTDGAPEQFWLGRRRELTGGPPARLFQFPLLDLGDGLVCGHGLFADHHNGAGKA